MELLVGHNLAADYLKLKRAGWIRDGHEPELFDTMIAAFFQGHINVSLADLTANIRHQHISEFNQSMLDGPFPSKALCEHNSTDVEATRQLYMHLKDKKYPPAFKLDMKFIPVLADMMERGIHCDTDKAERMLHYAQSQMNVLEERIPLNPNSWQQVSAYLGTPNAQAHTLEALDNPDANDIVLYKQLEKQCAFLEEYAKEEVIHSHFNTTVVPSGRLSSSSPNIQNVPKNYHTRSLFIPRPGHVFLIYDYNAIEYVVGVRLSKDPELNRRIDAGEDFHQYTMDYFNIGRTRAKNVNFLALYLGKAKGIIPYAGCSLAKAEKFLATYPLAKWSKQTALIAEELGYSQTVLGRTRPFESPQIAVNHVCQGTAIEFVKAGMIMCHEFHPVSQIHDEIIMEVPIQEAEEADKEVKKRLEHNAFGVKVKGGIYQNWGQAL